MAENGPQGAESPAETGALEAFIEEKIRAEGVPGLSIAVVKAGRVVWARGFGLADLATLAPAGPSTSYLWFSMTKIVTATAVMRLADAGDLDLDAPADEYFRGFKVVSQPVPVTVRHLLNHSSGLANPLPIRWVRPADAPASDNGAFVNRLLAGHRRLKFAPGERAGYSNLGYLVLGEVISAVSGAGYERYVREEVLTPLGMDRTGFTYPEPASDAATGYHPLWKPLTPLFRAALPGGIVGARQGRYVSFNPFYVKGPAYGGLVGGVAEAARFVRLHLNGGEVGGTRLLSTGAVAEMQRVTPRGGKRDFGLGWYRAHEAGERRPFYVEHLGGGAGFWNVMRIHPGESLGVVMMGNTTGYDHESILDAVVSAPWV
ncbi:serine hydrolase [Rubrobacter tropicus]|uniref:Serine hydrolase n=1 Tax=Rubrobacter tropicus TaxID=2653851 RepID=A0A6G8Q9V7_9ACTN|nr:serine hydrolase domain-containing protein [Rubrobacter tropicus]QIN83274.1 serine hydrolase [Rubrobacter tropicus]